MGSIDTMQAPQVPPFQQLVTDHSRQLFRLAYRMTGNEQDAEEIVQETLFRAYQRLETFDGRSALSTWLYRIAANCSIDLMRSQKKRRGERSLEEDSHPPLQPVAERPDPERELLGLEINQRVQTALEALSPLERAAFVLRHFQDLSIREISASLGTSQTAAKHAIFRAVRKLRANLEILR